MRRILTLALTVLATAGFGAAKDGYKITLRITDLDKAKDTMVYLAHYFGKGLPTIYRTDSAYFDKTGTATFSSKEKLLGGIYLMMLSDKETYFEVLLDNGDEMSITTAKKELPTGIVFKNSPQNEDFQRYITFLKGYGEKQEGLKAELAQAKTAKDTTVVRDRAQLMAKELTNYRRAYVSNNPGKLLSTIFNAINEPDIPEGVHYLPDGKVDSSYAYKFRKAHYWDGFNFNDERLIHTPIYDARLDEYMNRLVIPVPDSVIKEADTLLARTKNSPDLFRYSLFWLTRWTEESKIMGMDKAYVHIVENNHLRGLATWLDDTVIQKYRDRIRNIAPNMIGNPAPELSMVDMNGKPAPLSSVKGKYTVLVFWEPTCGHCKKEIPQLDSVYRAALKAKGVKMYAVRTDDPVEVWKKFVDDNKLGDWTHVYDPTRTVDYRSKYDVYSTPTIYLLDENKIIQGKRIDHSNVLQVIEMLERKERDTAKKS